MAERLTQLKELFPEAFVEGRIQWDRLRLALGDAVDERPERYTFGWAGKRDAIRLLQTPGHATLLPDRDASVRWDETENVCIEGDNLEVLKLLYKPYFGRVKMIYIDPPYNTGNDFIYPDNFADPLDTYLKLTGQRDAEGNPLTSNPETSGRYHSTWLSMMYPRLFLARQLLREDGVILVSIDDNEVANLKLLLNELYGEENFLAHITWQKRYVSNVTAQHLSDMHDHILAYARDRAAVTVNKRPRTEEQLKDYKNPDNDPRGPWRAQDLSASKPYSAGMFTITTPSGREVNPPPGRYWRCNRAQYEEWLADDRIWFGIEKSGRPMLKAFLAEVQEGLTPNTWWTHEYAGHNKEATLEVKALFDGASPFDTAKPVRLLQRLLEVFSVPDALVLDFFAGSATTGQAVVEQNREDGGNRRFILVQLPEPTGRDDYPTIADISRERVRRVIARMEGEGEGKLALSGRDTPEGLGFKAFRLAPSNFRSWTAQEGTPDPDSYAEQLGTLLDPLVDGWTPEGVIQEVALKEGYGLNLHIERVDTVPAMTVYRVRDPLTGQGFHISLDEQVRRGDLDSLRLGADDLFVCRDAALDDETAANLALQCRLKTI
jgi:adenine-specific DNA-methyltransferase